MEKLAWVGLKATVAERQKLKQLKQMAQRRSNSDMLRFLINNGEKILSGCALTKTV